MGMRVRGIRSGLGVATIAIVVAVSGFSIPPAVASGWTVTLTRVNGCTESGVGGDYACSLTATTNQDVGPTPYFIDVVDETAGTVVFSCASGTSCTDRLWSDTGGVHEYIAYVEQSYLSNVQAQSNQFAVVWWQVMLNAIPSSKPLPTTTVALVASVDRDVSSDGFAFTIYSESDSAVRTTCYSGYSCTLTDSSLLPSCRTYDAVLTTSGGPPYFARTSLQVCWGLPV